MSNQPFFDYQNDSDSKLEAFILEHGCYSPEENGKIYRHWFSRGPRYLFRAVDQKYGISEKTICDVGCAFGTNLLYCNDSSYGIEPDTYRADFARSLGLRVYSLDLVSDDSGSLPKVQAIWCSAVLEHVSCPYLFLCRLYQLLEPGGLIAIYVPTIPVFPFMERFLWLGKYVAGYRSRGHVNAFIPDTLRFVCEAAGFHTIEVSPFYPGMLSFFNNIPLLDRVTGRTMFIGRK